MSLDGPSSAFGLDFQPRSECFASPEDWRDVVVYQVVLDRFDDGVDHPSYDEATVKRGRDEAQGWHFQGGTLKGLTRRLEYINQLGANAVWVSCPLKQRVHEQTYHGYAIQDFLAVDPRFGTTEDFQEMVAEAHRRGMWVILDVVIDHAADLFSYAGDDGEPDYDVCYDEGRVYDIARWHDGGDKLETEWTHDEGVWPKELQRLDAWVRKGPMDPMAATAAEAKDGDFMSLKKINLQDRQTLSAVINCYKYWIAVAGVDGFRIDALRHVRHPAASDFIHAIREYAYSIGKKNFLQVGEVADGDEEMRRYIGTNVEILSGSGGTHDPDSDPDSTGDYPRLDAVIDFEYHRRLIPILLGEQPATHLEDMWDWRRSHFRDFGLSGQYFLSYLENHDQGGRDRHRLLAGTYGQTEPGYNRPGGDPRLAIMAAGVLLAGMGVPCLYYGTEQGFDGGSAETDTHVREAMFGGKWGPFDTVGQSFFDETHPIYRFCAHAAEVRRREPTLRYGRSYLRPISGDGINFGDPMHKGAFAIARVLDITEIVVVANPSLGEADGLCIGVDASLNPPGWQMRDLFHPEEKRYLVEEAPNGQAFVRLD
ncbi:MAG: alpha-amylase family glycosyl hydrolase, partial [Planctomycetota bacterium]